MTRENSGSADRLREPPRQRFSGPERVIDLSAAFAALPEESVARQGHMQKALYRHGPMTTAIFTFEAGSGLDRHDLDAAAVIHVLEGRVRVKTPGDDHEVGPGQLLLLDPGVPHDLNAVEATRMLLTVVLENGGSS